MKQRDYEKVCDFFSVTCAFVSCELQSEGKIKMANKFGRLAHKFYGLKNMKINNKNKLEINNQNLKGGAE